MRKCSFALMPAMIMTLLALSRPTGVTAAEMPPVKLSISGIVKSEAGQPLPYANIMIQSLGTGTVSSRDGSFQFHNLQPGRYLVSVSYIGYASRSLEIEVKAETTADVEFILGETLIELEPIVVTGTPLASDPMKSPQDINCISGREKLRLQDASLGESIEDIPGVTSISTGGATGKPVIRGHSGERVLVLVDGISQEYQQYGERHSPNIDAFNYDRIEVIKGASCLLYGSDAIGGAVNLIPPRPQFSASTGPFIGGKFTGKWNSVNDEKTAGLRLKGGTGRFGFHGSFATRTASNFTTPDEPVYAESGVRNDPKFTGEIDHTDYEQYSGAIALGYMFDPVTVTASHDFWWNENNFLLPEGGPIGLGLENRITMVNAFIPAGIFVAKPKISYQQNRRRATAPGISREFLQDSSIVDLRLEVFTARLDLEHRDTGAFSGTIGAEWRYYDHENAGLVPLQPTGHCTNAAVYLFEEMALGEYTLNAGLRLDYRRQKFLESPSNPLLPEDDENRYINIASSLGASRVLGKHFTAVAGVNQGFRVPSFFNSYVYGLHGGVFAFQIGDPDLEPELSIDFTTGLRFSSAVAGASLTGYLDHIINYIYLYNSPDHPLAPPPDEYEFIFAHTQDDARMIGLDISAFFSPLKPLLIGGDLSLINSEFLAGPHEGKGLPLMPATKTSAHVRLTLRDFGTLSNPSVRIKMRYASDKEAAGEYEPFGQFDDGIGPDIPFGVASTESYMLFDAGMSFDLKITGIKVNTDVEVKNIADKPYRDFLDTYKGYTLGPGRGVSVTFNVPISYQ